MIIGHSVPEFALSQTIFLYAELVWSSSSPLCLAHFYHLSSRQAKSPFFAFPDVNRDSSIIFEFLLSSVSSTQWALWNILSMHFAKSNNNKSFSNFSNPISDDLKWRPLIFFQYINMQHNIWLQLGKPQIRNT